MKVLVLLALIAGASARANPDGCRVSEWRDWGDWNLPNHDSSIESFPVFEKSHAEGRNNRNLMMELMQEQADIFDECMTEGSCPQFDNHRIDGYSPCVDGVAVTPTASYPCSNVDHIAFVPNAELFSNPEVNGTKTTNDIWGWVDPLTDEEYAIVGMNDGTSFVRITPTGGDPLDVTPVVLGHLKTAEGIITFTWRDIKVLGNYAFIVSEHPEHGMQVFDLTRLRDLDGAPPVRLTADAHYNETGHTHNIVASARGFVYLVGSVSRQYENNCEGGLHVIDVNDPLNPTYAGCFGREEEGGDGYVHDAQCFEYNGPDVPYQGREICMCYNEDTFTIVDVEDKANMQMISRVGYNSSAYVHQGWITEDHTVVLLDDELDERRGDPVQKTYIWDVTNLEDPILMNTYRGLNSIDHNQYIIGDLTFQANYRVGLRILRIDQAAFSLNEVAYFDVYPDAEGAVFNGAWSVYFDYPSGNVVVSSIEYGMYVLRTSVVPNQPSPGETKYSTLERRRYRDILEANDVTMCPSVVEIEEVDM